jgi:CubicO group peptidase (beta-lactamase class C family)
MWIDENHHPSFYGMLGHLGQRILVVPDEQLVIVRLGKNRDTTNPSKGPLDVDTYLMVDEIVKLLDNP